jgi:gliding motility-associated-like protein
MKIRGLNIFADTFCRMKPVPFLFFLFVSLGLQAQVSIHADVTSGCSPLLVNFSILPVTAADTIATISWDFGNGASSLELAPAVTYDTIGIFTVSCTINGTSILTETDMITVGCLALPNVFSPNDDGINDFFKVETNGTSAYAFSVYTRSGTLVYKTESPTISWDGRSLSGHRMKNGIYFYIIRQLDSEPLNEVKGIVYLFE